MTAAGPTRRVAAWTAAAALSFALVALVGLTAPSTRGALLRSFGTSDGGGAGMPPTTLGLLATATVGKGEAPAAIIRELIPRTGLPHVFSKVRCEEGPVRVAFLGGSVTSKADCWRPQVMGLLRTRYPAVEWEEINASLGGTGSLFGAFRVDRSVLAYKPDLLFVEYAANDRVATTDVRDLAGYSRITAAATCSYVPPLLYTTHIPPQPLPTAEGIIRKVRRALPDCDVAIVYITTEALTKEYNLAEGRAPAVVQIYERLADHYEIPSIHLGLEIVERAAAGEVVWYGDEPAAGTTTTAADMPEADPAASGASSRKYIFGSDGIHPHKSTGCAAYAQAVGRSLAALEQARPPREPLPSPINPNNYEDAQLVGADHAALSAGVRKISPDSAPTKPYANATGGYLARRPGDTFTLRFYGSMVGVSMIVGPWTGDLLLTIDDGAPRSMQIYDTFCYRPSGRLGFYGLCDGLVKGNHTLVVDVSPSVPEKESIMAAKNRRVPPEYLNDTDAVVLAFGFV